MSQDMRELVSWAEASLDAYLEQFPAEDRLTVSQALLMALRTGQVRMNLVPVEAR